MKHSLTTALLWVTTMVVLTSCGATNNNSFTARSRYIEGGRIQEQPKTAEIDVDFSMRVTAQSDWQPTKSAARTEAEHKGKQQQCNTVNNYAETVTPAGTVVLPTTTTTQPAANSINKDKCK